MKPRKFLSACHMASGCMLLRKKGRKQNFFAFQVRVQPPDHSTSCNRILVQFSDFFRTSGYEFICAHKYSKVWGLGILNNQGYGMTYCKSGSREFSIGGVCSFQSWADPSVINNY